MTTQRPLSIEYFDERATKVVDNLARMVAIESPTGYKPGVDRMGSLVAAEAQRLGAEVQVDRQESAGDHVIARWNAPPGKKGILLLCHMDTVHPIGSLERNPWKNLDGKLYGPGALDMKAGIAVLFAAVEALQQEGRWSTYPITALFTSDEETGSLTSRSLIETHARESAVVFCLEPSMADGGLKTWRKGVGGFKLLVTGKAAHAGVDHANGRNAIVELAHQLIRVHGFTDYERGTTFNIGVIQGGTASNVVPQQAFATIDLRVVTEEDAQRAITQLESLHPVLDGTHMEITGGMNRPPMPRDARMAKTFQVAQEIAVTIGLNLTEGGTGGGSDANFVAPLGVPVLDGLGGRGNGAHSDREYVMLSSLTSRAALLAALLSNWPME